MADSLGQLEVLQLNIAPPDIQGLFMATNYT